MVRAQQRVSSSSCEQDEEDSSIKHENSSNASGVAAAVHAVVDSDDEDTTAEEYEWGLAQQATDPYIKQRVLKGRFVFIKIAGCEGFHCYESELLERLAAVGVDVSGGTMKQQPVQALAATGSRQGCNSSNGRPLSAEPSSGSASGGSASSGSGCGSRRKRSNLQQQQPWMQPAPAAGRTAAKCMTR